MGGSKRKRPAPSYEEGRLRDPAIEKMQDPRFGADDMGRIIKKAVSKKEGPPKGANS